MSINTPILQLVGFQNSGKTTLVSKLLGVFKNNKLRIGALKHHGHDGSPLGLDTNKDTFKHRSAGATITGVEGKGLLQITCADENYLTLDRLLELYETFSLDLILVEGFKNEPFPKIVLLKTPQEEELLKKLSNIILLICWYDSFPECDIPVYSIQDESGYISWIQAYMKKEKVC
ncbi:molybdopterin-guanine dinucleotide biosynthesis protein B [Bacillus sp. 1NLA3E]|uniref:molybdopterin-guanine dinucleotide biosynthesis protein B n=1 Tax=Bacillus sp. 1NLA3E TaxID=666686 RepID=UPI000317708A|nr:molybdopterin-guanine dinucleotide biosynthesis protein B [Bacillus sp. 1NLA3E]